MQTKNLVYHATSLKNAKTAMAADKLFGYSTHRLHRNGTVPWPVNYKTFTPAYLESEWYFGVCLTRSKPYALRWNQLVLTLNLDTLKHRHKVVPYNWSERQLKAEFEEFLITRRSGISCAQALNPRTEEGDPNPFSQRILAEEPLGYVRDLSRHLTAVTFRVVSGGGFGADRPKFMQSLRDAAIQDYRQADWLRAYCLQHGIALYLQDYDVKTKQFHTHLEFEPVAAAA